MDGTGWSPLRSTLSAGDTSPDGSELFLLVEASETNANGSSTRQTQTRSAATYSMSVFAKAGPDDAAILVIRPSLNADFSDAVQAWFDLEAGTVLSVSASSGSSVVTTPVANIEDWGNGVYRCVLTFTLGSESLTQLRYCLADANASLAVTIGKQVQLWGAQLEAGSFPTSYISTAGAAASRSADVASIPTSAFGYNADKGTVVVDFETIGWQVLLGQKLQFLQRLHLTPMMQLVFFTGQTELLAFSIPFLCLQMLTYHQRARLQQVKT
jgi:hypothetical protein